jgi:hypothetical protein
MPTIYAANESSVLVDGQPVEGVQALEYRRLAQRANVYAVGSAERIGVVSGGISVDGRIRVASASAALDARLGDAFVQIIAVLHHGDSEVTLSFQDCLLTEKTFALGVGGHGEATYAFTATRVSEDPAPAA